MQKEVATFAHYGKSFQEKLTTLILDDRQFSDQIGEVMDVGFFETKYLQVFNRKIFDYKEKYGTHPTKSIVETILRTELEDENDLIQAQVRDFFVRTFSNETELKDAEYVKENALEFCKKQKLKEAMIKSVELLKDNSFEKIKSTLDDALKLGTDTDFGYDYILDFDKRFELKARNPVSTGWQEVDGIMHGGLGKGELGVVVAPTGAGKSMALVHLGAQAIKQGRSVIHYTLELQDTVIGNRYDACITGFGLNALHGLKDEIYEKIKDMSGGLIIKEYPTKSASTQTLRAHLEKLRKREVPIDMIIMDYGDLLRPVATQKEKRNELESIYEEMRGIAQEYECPVWTASQTNRSGLNADVITMESISEAFNKCFVADFICSISRTAEDKQAKTARMFVAKNRNGIDGLVYPMYMDTRNIELKVLPYQGDTPGTIAVVTAKEQREKLKERYKEFKEDKK
jgi:replicative DNA helicase